MRSFEGSFATGAATACSGGHVLGFSDAKITGALDDGVMRTALLPPMLGAVE